MIQKLNESSQVKCAASEQEAIILVTIYDKIPWSPCYVTRLSQHAFLSSQTLDELCKAVPCAPYASCIPSSQNESVRNYVPEEDSGCVLCIEGVAYGENDYARKFVNHLVTQSKLKTPMERATSSLAETSLSSMYFRINEPYWLLHRGNCEHFVVIEQIRAIHPSDPQTGYPILLQHTPQLLDICRACSKSPAAWSIVNDIRLGESPSYLCTPCWENMGLPDSPELGSIEVIPLLYHVP